MKRRTVRTNLELGFALLKEAAELTRIGTRRLFVRAGLQSLIDAKKRLSLSDLKGKINFAPNYNHKALGDRIDERGR